MLPASVLFALLVGICAVFAQHFDINKIHVRSDDDLKFVEDVVSALIVIPEDISTFINEIGDQLTKLVNEWDAESRQQASVYKESIESAAKLAFLATTGETKKTTCEQAFEERIGDLLASKKNKMSICSQGKLARTSVMLRKLYNVEQKAIKSASELSKNLAPCTLSPETEKKVCLGDLPVLAQASVEQMNTEISSLSEDIRCSLDDLQATLSSCITDSFASTEADIENEAKKINVCKSNLV